MGEAHRICVSPNSRLESKEEEEETHPAVFPEGAVEVCGDPDAEGNDLLRVHGL